MTIRFARAVLAALLVTLVGLSSAPWAAQSPATQQPARPTFRADVDAVQLDLRVVDRDGHFIDDLTKDEFRVFEDGREQVITTFTLVNVPLPPRSSIPAGARVDPDVASNAEPTGRLYVIVLDDLEDQVASPLRSANYRAIAKEFIERSLTETDRAAIVATSGRRDMVREFTNDKTRLLDAARRFEGGYGQRTFTFNAMGAMVPDNLHSTMISLTGVADWLAKIDGRRKGIVLISERLGRSMNQIDLTLAAGELQDVERFTQAAGRGNVSLYVIDPIGVPTGAMPGIKPVFVDDGEAFDLDRIQSLVTLAEATGGFAAVHSNDFSAALDRIVTESSSYYVLGFTSSNPTRDGKFRKIEVRTTRPDLTVRARSGYVAPKRTPDAPAKADPESTKSTGFPPALTEILQSPLPVPGLPLSVTAPSFRGPRSTASVAVIVEAGASQLQFTPNGEHFDANLTLAIAAVSGDGKVQAGERGSVGMKLSPGSYDAAMNRGTRVVSRLELKPGRYQLRIAALDPAQGTTKGSVLQDLDVPDFSKGQLAISGILIASVLEPPMPTTGSDLRWKETLGEFPTTRRDFSSLGELREYVEIYDNEADRSHTIEVTSTIRDESGRQVFRRTQTLPSERAREKSVTHHVLTTIPLNDLRPGRYVLSVEARSSARAGVPVSRQVPFSIR